MRIVWHKWIFLYVSQCMPTVFMWQEGRGEFVIFCFFLLKTPENRQFGQTMYKLYVNKSLGLPCRLSNRTHLCFNFRYDNFYCFILRTDTKETLFILMLFTIVNFIGCPIIHFCKNYVFYVLYYWNVDTE